MSTSNSITVFSNTNRYTRPSRRQLEQYRVGIIALRGDPTLSPESFSIPAPRQRRPLAPDIFQYPEIDGIPSVQVPQILEAMAHMDHEILRSRDGDDRRSRRFDVGVVGKPADKTLSQISADVTLAIVNPAVYAQSSKLRQTPIRSILMAHGCCFDFFERGDCKSGVECKYSHLHPGDARNLIQDSEEGIRKKKYYRPPTFNTYLPGSQDIICFTYARKGWCIHGDKCWNKHIDPESTILAEGDLEKLKAQANGQQHCVTVAPMAKVLNFGHATERFYLPQFDKNLKKISSKTVATIDPAKSKPVEPRVEPENGIESLRIRTAGIPVRQPNGPNGNTCFLVQANTKATENRPRFNVDAPTFRPSEAFKVAAPPAAPVITCRPARLTQQQQARQNRRTKLVADPAIWGF